jgi:5-methylcytosine-specific restriction endonuclease McrA
VCLLARNRVNALESYDRKVRSVDAEFEVPAVAILKSYANVGRRRSIFNLPTHKNIIVREGFKCAYCGCRISLRSCTKDHVIPRCKGGQDTLLNVVAACRACNGQKADRTPREAGMELRSLPRALTEEEKLEVVMKTSDSLERRTWLSWLKKTGLELF